MAAHTSSIGAGTKGAEKPTVALWSAIPWDTIKIDWTWHLDVEPRKRSSARAEFQPMTFSRVLLFADGRWPEINVTRASKLLWLKGTNGAKWSESTNASEALQICWCAREQKLRQSQAAASDFECNVPGIFCYIVYIVLAHWSIVKEKALKRLWTRSGWETWLNWMTTTNRLQIKAVEFYHFTGNNFECLPSHIRVCLQELYCWRLVRAISTLQRGLCF